MLITKSMLQAEKKLSKKTTNKYQWSPTLKKSVQAYRFWCLKLRQLKGSNVSKPILQLHQTEGGITADQVDNMDPVSIICGLKQAYTKLLHNQKHHKHLRATHLEALVEAIVLHQSPNLVHESVSAIKSDRMLKVIKNLKYQEKMRTIYRKLANTLNPQAQSSIDCIDIPDNTALGMHLGDPMQPKTWKGPWKTLCDPTEVAHEMRKVNIQQYNRLKQHPWDQDLLQRPLVARATLLLPKTYYVDTLPHYHRRVTFLRRFIFYTY
jgi:hypothetical protein